MKPTDHISLLVTAGDGPAECRQTVTAVLRRMGEEAVMCGVALSLHQTAEKHGPRSAVVTIHGAAREGFAKRWRGTIQWTAQSRLRPHHKRRNWFVGVFALDDAPAQARLIRPEDVAISTLRAGGPGGQHQNTTDSAVRARHTPTGLTLVVRDGRSQHRNRALALERLQALATAQAASDFEDRKDALNRLHHSLQRGAPTRRFKGGAFREVE